MQGTYLARYSLKTREFYIWQIPRADDVQMRQGVFCSWGTQIDEKSPTYRFNRAAVRSTAR